MEEYVPLPFTTQNIVRLHMPGDGSCMVHSLFFALSKTYRDAPDRVAFVKDARTRIAGLCAVETYLDMPVSRVATERLLVDALTQPPDTPEKVLMHKLVTSADLDAILSDPEVSGLATRAYLSRVLQMVADHYDTKYHQALAGTADEPHSVKVRDGLVAYFRRAATEAVERAHTAFADELETAPQLGIDHAQFLAQLFGVTIHFVSSSDNMPYHTGTGAGVTTGVAGPHVVLYYTEGAAEGASAGHFDLLAVAAAGPDEPVRVKFAADHALVLDIDRATRANPT